MRKLASHLLARLRHRTQSWWYSLGRLPLVRLERGAQLRRLRPLAGGRQRGTPVIRAYWHRFLDEHRSDMRGRCLEVGGSQTLNAYAAGAASREALDVADRPGITVVADLARADALAPDTYDCIVVPFTLHCIYDIDAALYHLLRILKPGGVLLANFPCVDSYFPTGLDMHTGTTLFTFWWFTPIQIDNLVRRAGLGEGDYRLRIDGNLFARVAYQMNLPAEELTRAELELCDPAHPLLVSARIVKPDRWELDPPAPRTPWLPDVEPAQWDPVTGHYSR